MNKLLLVLLMFGWAGCTQQEEPVKLRALPDVWLEETFDTCMSKEGGLYIDFVWSNACGRIKVIAESDSAICFRCTRPTD